MSVLQRPAFRALASVLVLVAVYVAISNLILLPLLRHLAVGLAHVPSNGLPTSPFGRLLTIFSWIVFVAATLLIVWWAKRRLRLDDRLEFWWRLIGWYLLLAAGWDLYRDIAFSSINGMAIMRNYVEEAWLVAKATLILGLTSYLLLFGWEPIGRRIVPLARRGWQRFYATWLS